MFALGVAAGRASRRRESSRRGTWIESAPFGTIDGDRAVDRFTMTAASGVSVQIITLGATIQSVLAPDRHGRLADITLGYDDVFGYQHDQSYVGQTIGRVANRIANGAFELCGRIYRVDRNEGRSSLHGGKCGFGRRLWSVVGVHRARRSVSVTLSYESPDGDMGYPGRLSTFATYRLDSGNSLSIDYRASTSAPTIVNLTNHAYWNLAGEASGEIVGQWLWIRSNSYTPVRASRIPTGQVARVRGTAYDFRTPKPIGRDIDSTHGTPSRPGGYDCNWVLGHEVTRRVRTVAEAWDPISGRVLRLRTDQPGLQFYTGEGLSTGARGKGGRVLSRRSAFALEAQSFPDAPHHSNFPSVRLDPGRAYRSRIVYQFSVDQADSGCRASRCRLVSHWEI